MKLQQAIESIHPLHDRAMAAARARWDSVAKPLHSLGLLEDAIVKIAGITGSEAVDLHKRGVVVMCADNGVVEEGVTQTGSEVTAIVTENFTRGMASVNKMAKVAGADVIPVDIGVACPVAGEGLLIHKVAPGTANMTKGPAMTRAQALDALEYGIGLVFSLRESGYRILATGEMGIGNTTTSSALAAVFLGAEPAAVTGRGAGLSSEGMRRKVSAIERAIEKNRPDPADPIGVLQKVGGLDLAGLCGVFIGGAAAGVPVLIDGFISAVAALTAARIAPAVGDYLLASHASNEPGGRMVLEALGLEPFLTCRMCLGEGTGAVAALPLLDMALAVYREMGTFGDIQVEEYKPLD
ncbi:MAG: nicotinate-nucleotide--dimethylbenzimidazole phosphoribosyltransferase [Clostridiales bacterium]|uniref:Nicotinate-nucleotide--dimethylbenzimidazole phosphoribosyltransferase n=1 Tax=Harryflintia acetispora TaxID=1849041 RepID=A0A9X8Y7I2_9FIRM|nr:MULTISPECIES: nicotinate-nucleotide--dimethylbenzimidazole phosphoribosyltransferase [Oscillospiraceae]PWM37175.1 MAG: nicotinate-nucleotide--dimethylbenzimidazole phosphoribosyltransferase [Clostridiales bacterium]RGB70018.1 nicotinate-nucleotide--dimethylbenzimidazole phosphoribosyltransferase [Harryflintia acetispora]TCL42297.1 nicotinate-nucleotide-dimethylbenzimidazole phosphoribosyltransferase [Harryflintia acetispora]